MRRKIKKDDSGNNYMVTYSESWEIKARRDGKQADNDISNNILSVIAVKKKLHINISQLKKYCTLNGIDFDDDTIFSEHEYGLIKNSVVQSRNKK